ncbi:MAG: glycoside hydrolase family 25 protein, partial [Lachnospiraceae bacterium]|nr:glycoside hydrolase family 25 protein [Lachnospiraceae bacterium]
VRVVMIRVGYRGYGSGKLVEDAKFREYVEAALSENLRVGVYFYTQGINMEEGIEEARFVLDIIKDYNITCPVAIDTEALYVDDARTNELDNTARTDVVVGFCDTVKEAGYTPMIYTNRNWLVQMLDVTRLGGYKIWYAHYTNQPDLPYEYVGWQYTDSGTLNGVSGSVDLNVWFE